MATKEDETVQGDATSGSRSRRKSATVGKGLLVRAMRTGYYDNKRRKEGEIFTLKDADDFSDYDRDRNEDDTSRVPGWMRWVEPGEVPEGMQASARRTIGETVVKDDLDSQIALATKSQATVAGPGEEGHELVEHANARKEAATTAGTASKGSGGKR